MRPKRTLATLSLAVVLCILVPTSMRSQAVNGADAVVGSVLNTQEKSVPGAKISVTSEIDGKEYTAFTDASGKFMFPALRAGNYQLRAFADRDGTAEGTFSVTSDSRVELHITVTPRPQTSINVIEDNSEVRPPLTAQSATVEEMQQIPASEKIVRIEDRLTLFPGVIQNTRGNLNIDGAPDDQNRLLLDSLRLDALQPGAVEPRVPLLGVQQVQIVHNGYEDATTAPGAGGTIAILSKEGGADQMKFNYDDPIPGPAFDQGLYISEWRPRFSACGPIVASLHFCDSANLDYTKWIVIGQPAGKNA